MSPRYSAALALCEGGVTPALQVIVSGLTALEHPDGAALACVLGASLTQEDVRQFVSFGSESCGRALIFRNERVELRLCSWRPGQSTAMHGHNDAARVFRVIAGTATETILGERDRVWSPGSVVATDGLRVHQVQNAGSVPLLTLHAYGPPQVPDAPVSPSSRQFVIVGGGFSGAAVVYHLLRGVRDDVTIHVVEAGPWFGRGIAYGVENECFRLNVAASRMSLDPAVPDDFVRFAGARDAPSAFLHRALFARYVTARVGAALRESRGKLQLWRGEAVAVSGGAVVLRSGRRLRADALVLATGLTPRLRTAERCAGVVDAWDERALATLPRKGHLLLLGSGLTALDVLAFLETRGFEGNVTIVSRHGLLPFPHEESGAGVTPVVPADVAAAPSELMPLVRWVGDRLRATGSEPWQRSLDGLRPHVAALYRKLSPRDRARFVRHVRPYWDIFRHRAPPDMLTRVDALTAAGRLRRMAGRVSIAGGSGARIAVEISQRSGKICTERFDAVVRCIGPALSLAEGPTPFVQSLLSGGLARVVPYGLGIETLDDGRIVDAHGAPASHLFGIGAVCRASHWETTSVPEITVDAQRIAAILSR